MLISEVKQYVEDLILEAANGELSIELFNRLSKIAELKVMDWITGDISAQTPPEPYLSQKNRDWATPFLEKNLAHAVGGAINKPNNYYGYDSLSLLGNYAGQQPDCIEDEDEPQQEEGCNTNIVLLDSDQFTERCHTYVKALRPSMKKPIAQEVGKTFEFMPKDIGSVKLQYFRYPVFGKIISKIDPVYNEQVPDEALSTNYEWDEKAMPVLVWFIVDLFSNRTSNRSMKEMNISTPKTPHG